MWPSSGTQPGSRTIGGPLTGKCQLRPEYALLKSIPGIDEKLAIVIMLEIGDIARFADMGNFASYARCVDSARYSNGKKKGEGNTRNGNAYLVWAFIEAANFAGVSVTRPDASLTRRKPKPIAWWPPKHWHTKLRGQSTTS